MDAQPFPSKYRAEIASLTRQQRRPNRHYRPRLDGRSAQARRIKALIAAYSEQFGEAAGEPLVQIRLRELCETEVLLDALRAQALRGEPTDMTALPRLANLIARQRAALGLGAAPSDPWGDV
jgi:hypothetical protein